MRFSCRLAIDNFRRLFQPSGREDRNVDQQKSHSLTTTHNSSMASGLKSSCPGSRTVVEPYARGAPSALPARAVYLDGQRCRQGPCHVASNFLKAALVEHAQPEYAHSCTPLRTRRGVLAALLSAGLAVGMPQPAEAAATASPGKGPAGEGARVPLSVEALPGRSATPSPVLLHSKRSEVPCSLTIRNSSGRAVEALWVNYDGEAAQLKAAMSAVPL